MNKIIKINSTKPFKMNQIKIINLIIKGKEKMINSQRNSYVYYKNKHRIFYNINSNILKYNKKSLFLIIVFISLLKISVERKNISGSSYIILKTNKTSNVKVFSNDYPESQTKPIEIRINGIIQTEIRNTYNLNESFNIINLTFSDYITDSTNMFKGCTKLEEIDLSHFDTSKIDKMGSMFQGCTSLYSIDFSNIDTSNVKDMSYMFVECSSLKAVDLSSFDTSNVMSFKSMFDECEALTSLDLSTFDTNKVTNMNSMFSGCLSLYSLNFMNLNTTKETFMNNLFTGCSNLKFINLENAVFDMNKITMPYSYLENLKVCSRYLDLTSKFSKNILINCTKKNI